MTLNQRKASVISHHPRFSSVRFSKLCSFVIAAALSVAPVAAQKAVFASFDAPDAGEGTFPISINQNGGTTSAPQHVQVTNSGSAPLTLSEIYLTGVDYKEFSQSNNCNAIVAAGASCTITVTFTPKTVGKRSAFIGLIDTGGGTPQTVTLAGTGA
jgi:hypothetical protein